MHKQHLSPDQLRELIDYNSDTGSLVWKARGVEWFSSPESCKKWNTRRAGKEALHGLSQYGYRVGTVDNEKYTAHRVAWAIFHGSWPKQTIDHINGNRADNKIENLRDVSASLNCRNAKRSVANSSGYGGVSYEKGRGKWCAYIAAGHRPKNLGRFNCITAAIVARKRAEIGLGFTDRHGV